MEEDENTLLRSDPRWARIRVIRDVSSNPRLVVVSEEDRSFEIQLWWEIQPQMSWESWTSKNNRGSGNREEGEETSRARGSVKFAAQNREKKLGKSKGVLHRGMEKHPVVEGQLDESVSWEEQKLKIVEEQKRKGGPGWETGCLCSLGSTGMEQERRGERVMSNGLGENSGGGPSLNKAQPEEAKITGPLKSPKPKDQSKIKATSFYQLRATPTGVAIRGAICITAKMAPQP